MTVLRQVVGQSAPFPVRTDFLRSTGHTSNPPVTFRLHLTGPDEAKRVRVPQDGPPSLPMVRQTRQAGRLTAPPLQCAAAEPRGNSKARQGQAKTQSS